MSKSVLEVEDVWKIYANGGNRTPVLRGITMGVREGEFLVVGGPSGSGKSTLLKLMGLLDVPSVGNVLIDEIETVRADRARIRNRKIGFVFQSFNLIPELTVMENVLLPTWISGRNGSDAKKNAVDLIRTVGLEERIKNSASQLSGGQMQRVAIARALINHPSIVLADEPTGNLDSKNAQMVLELFKKLNEERQQTFVIVSHNPLHRKDADRVVEIVDGQVDGTSSPSSNFHDENEIVSTSFHQTDLLLPNQPNGGIR